MFYIFTCENITFSKYAFYFINNSLYFITLYIINDVYITSMQCHDVVSPLMRQCIKVMCPAGKLYVASIKHLPVLHARVVIFSDPLRFLSLF